MLKTRYLENLNVVVHIGSQTVTAHDILQAALEWESHEAFDPGVSTVWDLVAADFEVNWAQVKQHGAGVAERFEGLRHTTCKNAWVIADDVVGVVIDSIHLAFPWQTQWQTFSDADEAIAWVNSKAD